MRGRTGEIQGWGSGGERERKWGGEAGTRGEGGAKRGGQLKFIICV